MTIGPPVPGYSEPTLDSRTISRPEVIGLSTGYSPSDATASQTVPPSSSDSASSDAAAGSRSRRRKTSHLKEVPETLELRESLRARCEQVADRLDRSVPMTKDELEQVARRTLEEADLPESLVGWVMVMISTSFWRHALEGVPPERRLFLLPHCLKHAEGCPAEYDEFGMNCKECGACSIADFRGLAEEMGYRVLVAEGSPVVMKIIVGGYVDAVIGVACLNVLEKAIDKVLLAGIPCMAVPLLSSDCRNTKVDEAWVDQMIRTPYQPAQQETRSYVHLMRAAGDLFLPETLEANAPRLRGKSAFGTGELTAQTVAAMDAVEATEHIAYDFLARGGKHSRPFITLAAYDAMTGGDCTGSNAARAIAELPQSVRRAALSIETFHKASLVHDDIEDDDSFRYGQPSLHKVFGVPTAINVGDFLVGMGYRLISDRSAMADTGAAAQIDVMDCLAAAHMRLGEGQGAELLWRDGTDRRLTPLDALKIYALKTSPAFEAALYSGVRLGCGDDADGKANEYREAIRAFSRNLGVAFQILNDLGDFAGDDDNKLSAGGDIFGGRPTLLWALALESLNEHDRHELLGLADADCMLSDSERLSAVRRLYEKAGVFDTAFRLVDKHQQRAEQVADKLEPDALRRLLYFLVDTVLERPEIHSPKVVSLGVAAATV
ncbi:All-trans-nonaprenyl-diphosphate synthase (geranyl-diphosphate specific) [Stieleria maiorica]|uniref:All-trans-nonaprenyl-diphosphate synthase (Geranyl-diphosphate specific) n=1 Tax=Stieleria maiorica TaxID=2795974 RepID=A0A5B9MA44_9BACT|nr:polyprenyl synthetase family protein [Stieleria maiorica]QEF96930.1 All-trans-nonaprenyl-diphosphate synthase (geranyl-diphosphate specific) [Stieleria maiorica]